MNRRLTAYTNMLEASLRTPEQFHGPRPTSDEAERRQRVVALLRSLTSDEATALLQHRRLPQQLTELADAVGLPAQECERVLMGTAWTLSEGLRALPKAERSETGEQRDSDMVHP